MRAILQRVSSAVVTVEGQTIGEIKRGILLLLGVAVEDEQQDLIWMAEKVAGLRFFNDADGKMNLSVKDVSGEVLVVSQFTLHGDCRKGKRPSFVAAARPEKARELYEEFVAELKGHGLPVETGQFQASMQVSLVNEGPVTLMLDSRKNF